MTDATATPAKEQRGFETADQQLLHLVIHALYSNKEIFLRELISNASDANDKLRIQKPGLDQWIRISIDKEAKTLTISDSGVGMTRDQAIAHLGTIAKSGTREFLEQLSGDSAKDEQLIGQFGVGFYSAFMVADAVTVNTRHYEAAANEAVQWHSTGEGGYTIEATTKDQIGTDVILHLKEDCQEFLESFRLRNIVTQYSDHIAFPILMKKDTPPATDDDQQENKDEIVVEEEETINRAQALWTLPKNDIKDEDYKAFYKHISHDFEEPLTWAHNRVEGKNEYISLLFIPKRAPLNLFMQDHKRGLKLFIKRVFIMDDAEQFLPHYLRFVKGVIDCNDLPLNVSREILQSSKAVDTIRQGVVRKVLDMLAKMAKSDPKMYSEFWAAFGESLKEGPAEDFANKDKIAKLLRFASTHDDNPSQNVSLEDYQARMPSDQKHIYFIVADSLEAAKSSPHLEIFKKKGIEVLLLFHRVDEWLVSHYHEFEGKTLRSVAKGALDLEGFDSEEEKKAEEQANTEHEPFIKRIKEVLGERIKEAKMSRRLTESPSCVVLDENDMGPQMQMLLRASGQPVPESKPILELNPDHQMVQRLQQEQDEAAFKDWAHIMLDQAILAEGGHLKSPAEFIARLNKIWSTI